MDRWMDGEQDAIDRWVDTSSNIYFEKGGFTIRDNCTIDGWIDGWSDQD